MGQVNRKDLFYAIEEEASYQKLIDVLRAVVNLHQPTDDPLSVTTYCLQCRDEQWPAEYPCPTIQAIEKELD